MCNCGGKGVKPKIKYDKSTIARRVAALRINALNRIAAKKINTNKAKKKIKYIKK